MSSPGKPSFKLINPGDMITYLSINPRDATTYLSIKPRDVTTYIGFCKLLGNPTVVLLAQNTCHSGCNGLSPPHYENTSSSPWSIHCQVPGAYTARSLEHTLPGPWSIHCQVHGAYTARSTAISEGGASAFQVSLPRARLFLKSANRSLISCWAMCLACWKTCLKFSSLSCLYCSV